MGVRTEFGTDTAWTFEPAPLSRGAEILKRYGWDGKKRVLVVCPINPFWWPVKPDLTKVAALKLTGQYKEEHYKSIYFHASGEEIDDKLDRYIEGLAQGVRAFQKHRDVFTIMVGMEKLDRMSCELLADRLETRPPVLVHGEL